MLTRGRDLVRLLIERQLLADGLLAVALAGLSLASLALLEPRADPETTYRPTDALGVALVLLQTIPLAWRRREPTTVYAIVGGATVVHAVSGYISSGAGLGVLIAIYTVATAVPLRHALSMAGIYMVGLTASLVGYFARIDVPPEAFATEWLSNVLVLVVAFVLGVTVRTRRAYIGELEARTRQLENEQGEHARLAVALERGRIARELHDAVAHAVSVMVVQAAAAERLVERDPPRSREAIGLVAQTGRQALDEMRRLLGVLRDEEPSAATLAPHPGIDGLEALARSVSAAGLPVELSIQGDPRPMPALVDLSAYRIVQESLTNALKHAGPARARVILRYLPDALELRIADNGVGNGTSDQTDASGTRAAAGVGQGLIGIQERVALFDGELRAGPRPEGGFAVDVRIPLAGEMR